MPTLDYFTGAWSKIKDKAGDAAGAVKDKAKDVKKAVTD